VTRITAKLRLKIRLSVIIDQGAAPTYFPPHKIYRGIQTGGRFIPDGNPELFVDASIFANDPEVAAL
jgi:patatin-like phospholipase/acyl hydrolase